MSILYYLTILPPKLPGCEAVTQEIEALITRFGGTLVYVNPNNRTPVYVPRLAFGFDQLRKLRSLESDIQLHHFFNPDPFPFPFLRLLRRPVIYSLTAGVGTAKPNLHFFSSLAAITVADQRSLHRLRDWGLENVVLVRPGVDTSRFSYTSLALGSEIKLMVGSAPWTRSQFGTKGIDALLRAAQQQPWLHLVFLWRGVLFNEMMHRVRQMGIEDQVQVLDERVDVNQVLKDVHASVALASDPAVIHPYPHSLVESLAAGKPILVSRSIPMADYVEQTKCGHIVEHITPKGIINAVKVLINSYDRLQYAAMQTGQDTFSRQAMIASFEDTYARATESTA